MVASLDDLPLAAEPVRAPSIGRGGVLSSIGAALLFVALGAAAWSLGPLRDDVAAIRGEDAAWRAIPTLASLGRAEALRDDGKALRVRSRVAPLYAAHEAALRAYVASSATGTASAGPGPDRASVAAWALLRRAFARALLEEKLALAEYALTAKSIPAPFDPLLLR